MSFIQLNSSPTSTSLVSSTQTDSNSYCTQPVMSNYNASGSIQFSGFHPPSDPGPNGTWTLHTALRDVQDFSANTSSIYQTFWLNTLPTANLSASSLPYTGCVIALSGGSMQNKIVAENADESNSCDGIFSNQCQKAILSAAQIGAVQQIGKDGGQLGPCEWVWGALMKPPKGCPARAYDYMELTQPFGNPDFLTTVYNATSNTNATETCSADLGNGSASSALLFRAWQVPNANLPMVSAAATDLEFYDQRITNPYALVLTAFAKSGTPDAKPMQYSGWPEGFGDSRMMCMSPNRFEPGSRVVKNGGKNLKVRMGLLVVMLATASMNLP